MGASHDAHFGEADIERAPWSPPEQIGYVFLQCRSDRHNRFQRDPGAGLDALPLSYRYAGPMGRLLLGYVELKPSRSDVASEAPEDLLIGGWPHASSVGSLRQLYHDRIVVMRSATRCHRAKAAADEVLNDENLWLILLPTDRAAPSGSIEYTCHVRRSLVAQPKRE